MTTDLHARIAQLEAALKTSRDQTIFWEQKYTDDLAKAREERDTIQRLLSRQVRQDGARGRRKDNEIDALTAERDALREVLVGYADQFCEQGTASELCGHMGPADCSGCVARQALAQDGEKG